MDRAEIPGAPGDPLTGTPELFQVLFQFAPQGILIQDGRGAIIGANAAAERCLGMPLERMKGRTSSDPAWRTVRGDGSPFPEAELPCATALKTGRPVADVVMGIGSTAGGEPVRWIEANAIPLFRPGEPGPFGVFTTFLDITVRRRAEESLRSSEEKFALAFNDSPDSININRLEDGAYLAVNPGFTLITGYTAEDVLGRSSLPGDLGIWVDAEDRARLVDGLRRDGVVRGLEAPFRRKDGTVLTGLMSASLIRIQGEPCVLTVVRDITELREQSAQLERMNQLYAALSQVNQAIVWCPGREQLLDRICRVMVEDGRFSMAWIGWDDPETHEVRIASRHGDATGYLDGLQVRSDGSPLGQGPTGTAIREGRPCVLNDFQASAAVTPWHERGARSGFQASAAIPIRQGGRVAGALMVYASRKGFFGPRELALLEEAAGDAGFALDNQELEAQRRHLQEALKEREFFFRESQRAAAIGSYKLDFRTGLWDSSAVLDEIFGIGPDYVRSVQGWLDIIHPEDEPELDRHLREDVIGKKQRFAREYRIIRRNDRETRWVNGLGEVQSAPDGGLLFLIGTIRDITASKEAERERHQLEAQLQHAQKMDSLGSLAGGVAHDMNNILGAVLGLASANQELQPAGSPAWKAFGTIASAAERGGALVKGLLSLARRSPAEEHDLDLNDLLQEEARLLERTTFARIRFQLDLGRDLRPVRGDAGALNSALMNLCVNAVDAMEDSGTLTLRSRNVDEAWVEVLVEDDGCGMPREVLDRALDPFFTTKPLGKGTGLGLSMVYSTVKAHRGQMEIQSEPGRGTRVRLRFPASGGGIRVPQPAAEPQPAPAPAAMTVLVVDDDELIQSTVRTLLEILGHAVTLAPSGEAALAELEGGLRPDLVILDMNMPGLGGAGTLPRLRALRPDVPVLLATGRVDQAALDLARVHPGVTLLSKPFGMGELRSQLKRIAR